jgi:hypothetical protein
MLGSRSSSTIQTIRNLSVNSLHYDFVILVGWGAVVPNLIFLHISAADESRRCGILTLDRS